MALQIHPSAVVDPSAVLGEGVSIGAMAVIGADVVLGDGCEVFPGAHVQGPTVMGPENRIFAGAMVGFEPQDLKYQGERTTLEVGARNHFRECSTIHRGTSGGGGVTSIGDDNLFMVYSHVAHDCVVGSRTVFANAATLAGHVEVEDDVSISAFSAIHQFCRVGQHAYIGGYSVITRDALPFVKTTGMKPACYGINRIGLERKGYSPEAVTNLETAYRILVRSKLNQSQAIEELRGMEQTPEVEALLAFIEGSTRGVIRGAPIRKASRGG